MQDDFAFPLNKILKKFWADLVSPHKQGGKETFPLIYSNTRKKSEEEEEEELFSG